MEFKYLRIAREDWGDREVKGQIQFADSNGSVEIRLTEEHCQQMLSIVADALVKQTEATAHDLRGAVINAATPQLTSKE